MSNRTVEKIINDIERCKITFTEFIERAIKLNIRCYTDVILLDPPLSSSYLESKWIPFWRTMFDTLNIIFEAKGYYINLQKKVEYESKYVFKTMSERDPPYSYGEYKINWNEIRSEDV